MNWLKILPTRKNDRYIRYVAEACAKDFTKNILFGSSTPSKLVNSIPPTKNALEQTAEIAEKWWLDCQRRMAVKSIEVNKFHLFLTRKSLQKFAQKYYNDGISDGFTHGVDSYKVWSAEKIKKLESHNNATLKFKVKLDGKEYQVRIFVNDPVTCARISTDDGWYADGTTIRHPKDQWSSKIAVAKSLADAVIQFFTTDVEIDNTTVKIDQNIYNAFFDALFKKYPELRTK